jgi:N-acetylglucosaminyldiphosphoundecaprenol N-acetyl-beta-D-mannosaminyltransferase
MTTDQTSMQPTKESINILGVSIGTKTSRELIDYIIHAIQAKERVLLAYINIHAINLAQQQPWFKDYLNQASLTFCDGYGIKLGARLLGYHIRERFTPPDWLPELASICAQKGFRLYFLGARPGVADQAARKLVSQYPQLLIAGISHGYFDKTPGSQENELLLQTINGLDVDILVVGMGMPAQEKWLVENWARLNCRVALPIGAAFDYLAGTTQRAPRWLTDHGFEWLGRLLIEPGRLWKRYIVGIPVFLVNILRQRFGRFPLE